MDIDSLFKVPKLPTGGNKRRMPDNPTPEMLKRMRTEAPSSSSHFVAPTPPTSTKGKARAATVEDVPEEEEDDTNDTFAPGGDADYFAEEDDEGRFFGGGLTDEQKKILNIFDGAGGEGAAAEDLEELNITGIRRMLLKFDRAVKKNQDQRSKFPDDPTKFIDSEADLDSAIKSLLPLAQSPSIAYPELVKSGALGQLIDLMSHENLDIVIDVVELLHELTDEDDDVDDDETARTDRKDGALKLLIDSLLEHSTMELLVANLSRMNEEEDSDRQGIYHTLGIFENSIGFNPALAEAVVSKTSIMKWLLTRTQAKTHDENRGYASEVLAILLQGNKENRIRFGKVDGVDILLRVLSQYRRRDPGDADEIEFMENIFDSLCSALSEPKNKRLFLDGEGVELMVIMMKEKMLSRSRSIKVLDHALSTPDGTANCERFVDALGLKTLFSALMNKADRKPKSGTTPASEDTSHILGILSSLFSNLASDSPPRIRLLTKFVEAEYEKVDRLLEIRDSATSRLAAADKEIASEKAELLKEGETAMVEDEDVWYLRRLDGGLFTLQTVDYVLGWICMEDDGIRAHTQAMLGRKNKSVKDIVTVLRELHDNVGEEPLLEDGEAGSEAPPQKIILQGLIGFLESC
ncbi:hypothetical protein BS47DRAFT_1343472 [Hydnum rufescens UP504]|uniref:Beta-catenin-like protein 1 N-terminal domain-containing protein n=1 Tax=Hydnum rufescens UP504 TaxID=1448309 RepID=A0A9P6AY41_9AGAM|nr:hypothetical protein BS47DRAFT_1343472 [Hydnum rufescens UP504]